MLPGDFGGIPDAEWDRHQGVIARFEASWNRNENPKISDYVVADEPYREALVLELVHAELEFRLKAGESARVEDFLRRYPSLARDRSAVMGLIDAEWTFRRRTEPDLTLGQYRERFPDYRDEITVARADASAVPSPSTPGTAGLGIAPAIELSLPRRLGKYELRKQIGVGSFAVVYLAWDTVLGREVALKVPRPQAIAGLADVRVFLREARNAIDLIHPNIVAIYDASPIEGTICLIRAYIEGATLAEQLRVSPFSAREAAALIAKVADAIDYAHERGIYHRDLKPSNILLDLQGQPHVSDFGLAKHAASDSTLSPVGQLGYLIGTPAYMSPEQARGEAHDVDARSDVYSVGVVLYELLTGAIPFRGRGRMLLTQILEADPIPPRHLNDEVPRDLEAVCLKALAKDPAHRYQTAKDLAVDLRAFLDGVPIGVQAIRPQISFPGSRLRPKPTLTAALLLVLLVASLIFWFRAENRRSLAVNALERSDRSLLDLVRRAETPGREETERSRPLVDLVWDKVRSQALDLDSDPALRDLAIDTQLQLAQQSEGEGSDRAAGLHWTNAIQLCESLIGQGSGRPTLRDDLAFALARLAAIRRRSNELTESRLLLEGALKLRMAILQDRRSKAEAERSEPEARLAIAEALLRTAEIESALGQEYDLSEIEAMILGNDRSMAYGRANRPRLARLALDLANLQVAAHLPGKALRAADQGIRIYQEMTSGSIRDVGLARTRMALGYANRDLDHKAEAIQDFRRAAERFQALTENELLALDCQRDLGTSFLEIGRLLARSGLRRDALRAYRQSLAIRQKLCEAYPKGALNFAQLGETRAELASSLVAEGHVYDAVWQYLLTLTDQSRVLEREPGLASARREILRILGELVKMARSRLSGFHWIAGPKRQCGGADSFDRETIELAFSSK